MLSTSGLSFKPISCLSLSTHTVSTNRRQPRMCTTESNVSPLPSSTSHLNLILTSPPLTAASSGQDLHLPHSLSGLIHSKLLFSLPFIFTSFLSFFLSRAIGTDLSSQHSLLSSAAPLTPSLLAHSHYLYSASTPFPCLSHTC